MGRQGEVFEIDGDVALKARAKAAARAGAGASPMGLAESNTVASHSRRGGSGRAAGAASLSLWVWGSGQWLNGDRDLAGLLFAWQLQIAAIHYLVASLWGSIRRMAHVFFVSEWELLLYTAALDFWLIFLLLFNVSQAYLCAERSLGRWEGLSKAGLAGRASFVLALW